MAVSVVRFVASRVKEPTLESSSICEALKNEAPEEKDKCEGFNKEPSGE